MDATQRIRELAGEGLSNQQIAERLTSEGYKTDKGKSFDTETVRLRVYRIRKKKTARHSVSSDQSDISDTKPIPASLKAQIIQIVRAEVKAILEAQTYQKVQTELPPTPGQKVEGPKGKKVSPGERVKLGVTLDEGIATAFDDERQKRRISASELMDILLWNALGKPKMSFETSEESEP